MSVMADWYVLGGDDGRTPIPDRGNNGARWGRVAIDELPDGTTVSTVFLGLDHRHENGPPLLFETMVFGPDGSARECVRYSTWADAEAGHARIVGARRKAAKVSP